MEAVNLSWSYSEFKAYLLIFAAESNQIITEEEKDFIEAQVDTLVIKVIQKEINKDNDFQRIQKIMAYIEQNNLTKTDLDGLLKEIHAILQSDGKYDTIEQGIFQFLEKLFKM
tara:strand:+ start:423 stop:761 length:339 start_codon:yes stop_codon:yes gene_type:complete